MSSSFNLNPNRICLLQTQRKKTFINVKMLQSRRGGSLVRMSGPCTVLFSCSLQSCIEDFRAAPPILQVGNAIPDNGISYSLISPESSGSHRSLLSLLGQIGRMIKSLISCSATDSWCGPVQAMQIFLYYCDLSLKNEHNSTFRISGLIKGRY